MILRIIFILAEITNESIKNVCIENAVIDVADDINLGEDIVLKAEFMWNDGRPYSKYKAQIILIN